MTAPQGGSILPGKGPAPTIGVPTQAAEIGRQYTLADVDPIGRTEALIYGPPGCGKTVLASTFPPPFRWLDADNGLKSIRWAYATGRTALTKLEDLVAYRPTEALDGMYPNFPKALDLACDMIAHWFSPGEVEKWNTLVIDSATELNAWAIYKGLHLNGQYPTKNKPLSKSDEVNEQAKAMLVTGEQDYKSAMGLFMGVITDIRIDCAKFNKNLVLLCHEWKDFEETDNGGQRLIACAPLLIGQLRTRIAKDFDDIWYMQVFNGTEYKITATSSPTTVAKTRWGSIPDLMKEPDYRKILERVKAFHKIK